MVYGCLLESVRWRAHTRKRCIVYCEQNRPLHGLHPRSLTNHIIRITIPLSHFQRIYRKSYQYKRYRDSEATGNHGLVFRFVLAGPGNAKATAAR